MDFDLTAAAIIGGAAFADLAIRGIAFRRIDSFGLSLAAFSTVYSVGELAGVTRDTAHASLNFSRFAGAVVPLVVLLMYHLWCRNDLEAQTDHLFDSLAQQLETGRNSKRASEQRRLLLAIKPVARKAILVTFVGRRSAWFRPGKQSWRQEVVDLFKVAAPDVDADAVITEEKLLLPAWMRRLGLILFLTGGVSAYLAQVATIR